MTSRVTLTPELPAHLPHRALVARTLAALRSDGVWAAYAAGLIGADLVEAHLYRAAWQVVSIQNLADGASPEILDQLVARTAAHRVSLMDAFEIAIAACMAG